ncbi:competence type IV pilus ATPase ComGA [Evansella clarkii]|uniref:competence type IV pilus ATPase ComGA n=1 Tax=Evansella clarkii TaxID=79879 RepID=UPI001F24A36B|nr:competence type IV pilus ATPase ComGA [Evansella clarkii]
MKKLIQKGVGVFMEVEKKSKNILHRAASFNASDIHFVPMEKTAVVRFRIDGHLTEMERLPVHMMVKIISHLKFLSGMDVGERRRPQNSSLEILLRNTPYAMRLSTFPSSASETLVIRLFPYYNRQKLQTLAIFPNQAEQLLNTVKSRSGLFILCGPTGSGKTTTLYSLLDSCFYTMNRNIITLEDPVEQKHDNFLQMEINERAGVTYSEGLRSLLRHDPDIIMIGEIRDGETARMAVRAALTGHFVFSTMHSSDTLNAIRRLNDLGISNEELRDTVKAVAAQRLVEIRCPYCEECTPYCKKYRSRRRGAVFELLQGTLLDDALSGRETEARQNIKKLGAVVNKGIALGFIPAQEIEELK